MIQDLNDSSSRYLHLPRKKNAQEQPNYSDETNLLDLSTSLLFRYQQPGILDRTSSDKSNLLDQRQHRR